MQFDFSHLYNTETVSVTDAHGTELFTAVVKQISNGEKTDAQAMMMADIDIPTSGSKRSRERALQSELKRAMQSGVTSRISLYEEVAAIDSWSLKDASGEPVPVSVEAWRALPAFISSQIADAIERLNPELDEDFRGDDRD